MKAAPGEDAEGTEREQRCARYPRFFLCVRRGLVARKSKYRRKRDRMACREVFSTRTSKKRPLEPLWLCASVARIGGFRGLVPSFRALELQTAARACILKRLADKQLRVNLR